MGVNGRQKVGLGREREEVTNEHDSVESHPTHDTVNFVTFRYELSFSCF